ncbi:MAG: hypothetical protein RLY69_1157, partial [Verrucomicrobiota bacterium]
MHAVDIGIDDRGDDAIAIVARCIECRIDGT